MVRSHPQWLRVRELVRSGEIGELQAITAAFSYFNRDPKNVRNRADWGGGALMDIGCYPIQIARFLFEHEPVRAEGLLDRDPKMQVDRLTSAMLDFPSGQAVFTCTTQTLPRSRHSSKSRSGGWPSVPRFHDESRLSGETRGGSTAA